MTNAIYCLPLIVQEHYHRCQSKYDMAFEVQNILNINYLQFLYTLSYTYTKCVIPADKHIISISTYVMTWAML